MEPRKNSPYSRRTDFGSPDPLYDQMRALARKQARFFDLSFTSPAPAGIDVPHPLELLQGAPPEYHPDPRGLLSARVALASSYASRAALAPEQFLLTASTSEAYSFVLHVLCDPGDKILVPAPSYPLFGQLAQIAGVELVPYRIAYDGAFHTDLATLPTREEARRQRIKALFCVSPNNPTGSSLRHDELSRFRSLEIPLVVDEVFRPYSEGGESLADPLSDAEDHPLTIIVDGLSKRAGSPGLKLGWMLAAGPSRSAFLERAEWVSDAFLSPGSLVQHALPSILAEECAIQDKVRARLFESRRLLAASGLHSVGITELLTPGGFTALLRLPNTQSEEDWWSLLSGAGIWIQPGHLYGLEQSPAFALSLLTPPDTLRAALTIFCQLVRQT